MTLSERYGTAFEYCVTSTIFARLAELYPRKVIMTHVTEDMQLRGQSIFEDLPAMQKNVFEHSAQKIVEWLINNKLKTIAEVERVEIDRISDTAGVKGDVTDIRIRLFSEEGEAVINISLKHRHKALKHPRLTRVPEWIGLAKTKEDEQYKDAYDGVWAIFFEKAKMLSPLAKKFRELTAIDPAFIEENLYKPLYTLVKNFLKTNIRNSDQVKKLFEFMVGKFDYVKFIEHNGKIEIRDFSRLPKPNSVRIEYEGGDYLKFHFDNGLSLSGRLHTATEWLRRSIKFDIQPINLDSVVPAIYI
jgi:hypothetical protein